MNRISGVYGFTGLELEQAKTLMEQALDVRLSLHESLYRGGAYYRLVDEDEVELVIQRNYDCLDEELTESEFPEITVLLYLDGAGRAEALNYRLERDVKAAVLLRRIDY